MLSPHHGIFHLHKLLDGVADLLIKDAAVRYNKDRVNQRTAILFNADQLMRQPCDGVRFAASCTVLNQVTLTDTVGTNIGKQLFNHIQLMVARKYLFDRLLLSILVNFLDNLCKAKADCRERANANMKLAMFEFRQPPLLTDEEVEEILGRIDELIAWASDIKDYALQAAISGKQWPGYKLVEGRSNRKYTDENAVIAAVTAAGYDPYEHKILGVTAMTSLLGKKQFNDILGGLITKPQGKPTLVPDSDKRPAMTTIIDDFKEDN